MLKVLEEIIGKSGDFPSAGYLAKNGHSGLMTGISEYHGGIRNVKEKMGYELETKPVGYWKEKESLILQA